MSTLLNISICLTDIPVQAIQLAANGKKYLNLCVTEMQQVDQYGKTHTVYVSQSQEERQARVAKTYIGKGKMVIFDGTQGQGYQPQQATGQPPQQAYQGQGYQPQATYQQSPQNYQPGQGYTQAAAMPQGQQPIQPEQQGARQQYQPNTHNAPHGDAQGTPRAVQTHMQPQPAVDSDIPDLPF